MTATTGCTIARLHRQIAALQAENERLKLDAEGWRAAYELNALSASEQGDEIGRLRWLLHEIAINAAGQVAHPPPDRHPADTALWRTVAHLAQEQS